MTETPSPGMQPGPRGAGSRNAGRSAPRWMIPVLVISLALNLAAGGFAAGALLRGGPGFMPGHGEPGGRPEAARPDALPLVAALAPEDLRSLGRQVRAAMRDSAPASPRFVQAAEMLALLRAETFDRSAFEALLEVQADVGQTRIAVARTVLLEHIAGLTEAERLEYAGRVEAVLDARAAGR